MSTEFQFYKNKRVTEMNGCRTGAEWDSEIKASTNPVCGVGEA